MRQRVIGLGIAILAIIVIGSITALYSKNRHMISTFEECVAAGYPIMKSYPAQCATSDGTIFRENLGTEIEMENLIRVGVPRPNEIVKSPFEVSGVARGTWYLEASFPVRLIDANGKELAVGIAQAQSEWMTPEFVPFKATLTFAQPVTHTGTLIFMKDNPSGLPEHDKEHRIPVRFGTSTLTATSTL